MPQFVLFQLVIEGEQWSGPLGTTLAQRLPVVRAVVADAIADPSQIQQATNE
jgi:hypothetical protein